MPWPNVRDWLFGGKSFLAAILALYVAFAVGLDRPYWAMATVYIASQPLSGATRSKALYRFVGTFAGAVAAVALVPPLSNAPVLLSLALALWVGACLFVSLLDRANRGYASMLAGYTAAIIGFPAVTAPDQIFTLAITRVQEIGIGIVAANLVHSLIFPRSTAFALGIRLDTWFARARAWAQAALLGGADGKGAIRRLAAEAVEIDALAENLPFDATPWQVHRFTLLRDRMVMLLPILSSIEDRMAVLRALPQPAVEVEQLAAAVAGWVPTHEPPADILLQRIAATEAANAERDDWPGLMLGSLLARLREMVQVLSDTTLLRRQLAEPFGTEEALSFAPEGSAAESWHRDPAMALLSAAAAVLSILICCAGWIGTAWPDGAIAAELTAVACSFFAVLDDPVPAILTFLTWAVVGIVADTIILFALLPAATNFETLALVLAPFYLLGGVMTSMPATSNRGRAFTVIGATLLALGPTYDGDFPSFVNGATAAVLALIVAATVTRLMRSVGAEVSANRLLRRLWLDLARAAETRGNRDRKRYAGLMLDQLGRIAPRLAVTDAHADDAATEALADVRIGLNIIDLRRARYDLGDAVRGRIDAMLDALAAAYRARAHRAVGDAPRASLLAAIDDALAETARAEHGPGRAAALLGLVGIRRGLFPLEGHVTAIPGAMPGAMPEAVPGAVPG